MNRTASTDHPIQDLLAQRWSPYVYSDRAVPTEDLLSIFEAARWAASSYNEQPWRYIVATKDDPAEYERLLSCLVEPNQAWAKAAPVLAIGTTRLEFTRNGNPNGCAVHDLGLASASLTMEAAARGIMVHQMGGILPDRVRDLYGVPEVFAVSTGLALGYAGDPSDAPEELAARDSGPRQRKPLSEIVFSGSWESAAGFVG